MFFRTLFTIVLLAGCADPAGIGPRAPAPSWRADQVFGPDSTVPAEADPAAEGPLRVVYFSPVHDGDDLVGISTIFNHDLPEDLDAGRLLVIDPPVPGELAFVGRRAVTFRAAESFPRATRFFISVPATLRSADGRGLDEEPQWSLATPRPELLGAQALARDGGTVLELTWNQPIDLGVLERKLAVVARRKPVPYRLVAVEDAHGVVEVLPLERVPVGTSVQVTIQLGVQGVEGLLPSVQTERRTVSTEAPMQVLRSGCADAAGWGECGPGALFRIELDGFPAAASERHVTVEPAAPVRVDGKSIWVGPSLQEGAAYLVTLSHQLRDARGRSLDRTFRATFKTPSALRAPSVTAREVFVETAGDASLPVTVEGAAAAQVRWWPATPDDVVNARRGAAPPVPLVAPTGSARVVADRSFEVSSLPEGLWIVGVSVGRGAPVVVVVVRASLYVEVWRDGSGSLVQVRGASGPVVAEVSWLGSLGHTLSTGPTDGGGLARIPAPPGAVSVRAVAGARRGFAGAGLPVPPLRRRPPTLFAARRTLRPGDTVRVLGTAQGEWVDLVAVEGDDPLRSERVAVRDGVFVWEWPVQDVAPGTVTVRATTSAGAAELALAVVSGEESDTLLEAVVDESEVTSGEPWKVAVRGVDSRGAPLVGAVEWKLTASPEVLQADGIMGHAPAGDDPLAPTSVARVAARPEVFGLRGELVLDEDGEGVVSLVAPEAPAGGQLRLNLELRVRDVLVEVTGTVVGHRPGLRLRPSRRIMREGERMTVEAAVVDPAGKFQTGWRGFVALELWEPGPARWRRGIPCRYDAPVGPLVCGFAATSVGQHRLRFVAAPGLARLEDLAASASALDLGVPVAVVGPGYKPDPAAGAPHIWVDQASRTRVLLQTPDALILPPHDGPNPVAALRPAAGPWELFEIDEADLPTRVGVGSDWRVVGREADAAPLAVVVAASPPQARPGDTVVVTVRTAPDAWVEVEAVDGRLSPLRSAIPPVVGAGDAPRPASSGWVVSGRADSAGVFRVERPLPAGVGAHAFVAFARDGAGRSGSATVAVDATVPLVLTADAPESMGPHDEVEARAWVSNRSAVHASVRVTMGVDERVVDVRPGERVAVRFRLPSEPGQRSYRVVAEPRWQCGDAPCPPMGSVTQPFVVRVEEPQPQRRFTAARSAGAALHLLDVPDGGVVTVRLSRDRAPMPRAGEDGELSDPLPLALRRALLDTEAAATLDRDVGDAQRVEALQWAEARLRERDVSPAARAVCAVLLTSDDPTRARVLADLEPLSAVSDLPVWARAWLAIAWARRLDRVLDKAPLMAALDKLVLPTGPVRPGPSGLGTLALTRASVLLALVHSRPDDPRIDGLAAALVSERMAGGELGPFASAVVELALRRLADRRVTLGPPLPVEVWVDDVRVRRVGLGGPEESVVLNLTPGRHELVVAGAQDAPFWHALELAWSAPRAPRTTGFSVTRTLSSTRLRPGDPVVVTVRFVVTSPRAWVRVDGGLPAGFRVAEGASEQVFERLEPGIYEHRYTMVATRSGSWFLRPATVQAVEQPWIAGVTPASMLMVGAAR